MPAARPTYIPMERAAMPAAARTIIDTYRGLAAPPAAAHSLRYPVELEEMMLGRPAKIER